MNTSSSSILRSLAVIGVVLLAGVLFLATPGTVQAATCTSIPGVVNWNTAGSWDCGTVPTSADDVIIAAGSSVIVDTNASALTVAVTGTLIFANDLTIYGTSGDVLVVNNGFDLSGHMLKLEGMDGNISATGAQRTISGGSGSLFWIYGSKTVTASGGGSLVFDTNVTVRVSFNTASVSFGSGITTIRGTLEISSNGGRASVTAGPNYGPASTLVYDMGAGSAYAVGGEWPAGSSGVTLPVNVHMVTDNTNVGLPNYASRTMRGSMTLDSNTYISQAALCDTAFPSSCILNVQGNWTNNGGNILSGQQVVFNGTVHQTIGGSADTSFFDLGINNTAGVDLAHTVFVDRRLTLSNGLFNLQAYNLYLGNLGSWSGSSLGTSKMIVADEGNLCKRWDTTQPSDEPNSFIFPIGDDTNGLNFSRAFIDPMRDPTWDPDQPDLGYVYSNFIVCMHVVDTAHPDLPANVTDYITRYWHVEVSGSPFGAAYGASFRFDPTTGQDVVGSTSIMSGARWQPAPISAWNIFSPASANEFLKTGSTTLALTQDYTAAGHGPTAVEIVGVGAGDDPEAVGQVKVQWRTVNERDILGFNVYRSSTQDGPRTQLNSAFIHAKKFGTADGDSYHYSYNAPLGQTDYYWVEVVSTSGSEFYATNVLPQMYSLYLPLLKR